MGERSGWRWWEMEELGGATGHLRVPAAAHSQVSIEINYTSCQLVEGGNDR